MAKSPAQIAREAVWGKTSTRLRQSARLRDPAIRTYRKVARAALTGPPPKVFANSIPKSGTHLLSQLLGAVPKLWFEGEHLNHPDFRADLEHPGDKRGELQTERVRAAFGRVRDGQFVTGHFAWFPMMPEMLDEMAFVRFLMIRDPRDLVVSSSHWLVSRPGLPGYEELSVMSGDERLMAMIEGLPDTARHQEVPSIHDRLERFRPWLQDHLTQVVRFEDLVGERGGGTAEQQRETVRGILAHCNRETSDEVVAAVAAKAFAKHSRTFRRGVIGDWRNHFTPEHEARFMELAGDQLKTFGYV